jgi:hypothetical protein
MRGVLNYLIITVFGVSRQRGRFRIVALGCIAEIATRFISVLPPSAFPPPPLIHNARTMSCFYFFIIKFHNHHPPSSVLLIQVTHITAVLSAVSCCFSHLGKFYLLFFFSYLFFLSYPPHVFPKVHTHTHVPPFIASLIPQTANKQAKAALLPLRIIPQRRARIMYKNAHHLMSLPGAYVQLTVIVLFTSSFSFFFFSFSFRLFFRLRFRLITDGRGDFRPTAKKKNPFCEPLCCMNKIELNT